MRVPGLMPNRSRNSAGIVTRPLVLIAVRRIFDSPILCRPRGTCSKPPARFSRHFRAGLSHAAPSGLGLDRRFLHPEFTVRNPRLPQHPSGKPADFVDETAKDQGSQQKFFACGVEAIDEALQVAFALFAHATN